MHTEYTPAVSRALEAAQEFALQAAATAVQVEHLLQALVRDDEERPALLLAQAGLDLARYRRILQAAERSAADPELPIANSVRLVLNEARQLARHFSPEGTISSEQVLYALLRQARSLREQFEEWGLGGKRWKRPSRARKDRRWSWTNRWTCGRRPNRWTPRILDAGPTGAREALRVVEDYCRFVLNDAVLSGELKTLRHRLAEVLAELPATLLLHSRDTLGDVGTALSTPQEQDRASLTAVVSELKRLQEALRSLEEYGKLHNAELGQALEQLRYRSYTLQLQV